MMSSNVSVAKKKKPTRWRVVELVKECGKQKKLKEGIRIHAHILKQDVGVLLNQRDPFVGNSLITMYAKCGCLSKARETFEDIPVHDQCWAKFVAPTGNFPASHERNRNFKILAGHVPTNDNVNRNMLIFFLAT